jgi:glycosyltransferase involved in cell wall biosynthesis
VGWGFSPWRPGGLITYAEDLMAALAARGHNVTYFLSGRHYPYVSGPRLKRWRRGEVAMHEVINSPVLAGLEQGTRDPDRDLSEPRMEAAFRRTLEAVEPDVVHIQELHGLPSSFIEVVEAAGIPMLMTLQDYGPLCSTLRLFDADGAVCMRREIGADCVARTAEAAVDPQRLIDRTLDFEIARARRLLRIGPRIDFTFASDAMGSVRMRLSRGQGADGQPDASPPEAGPELAAAFQRRRDVNVERLGRVGRLVAQSARVAEIYRTLGVRGDRMSTMPFTLRHIEELHPREMTAPPRPVTFATLNGCASRSKGSDTVVGALRFLRAAGLEGRFRLLVLGHLDPAARDELASFEGVELRGLYRREELDSLLDQVDVGVVPSMWEEALGYTGLELIAKGIPLIANPLGGIVEYAREGQTAWLNRSCSGEGLGDIMSRLVRDPAQIQDMHQRLMKARDDVIIPMERHVDAIEKIYRDLIA